MNVLRTVSPAQAWLAFMIAAAPLPAAAEIKVDQYVAPFISYSTVVDWSATSSIAGHKNYKTFLPAEHYHGFSVKYFELEIATTFQSVGRCFEVGTFEAVPGQVADTQILVKLSDNPKWQNLADDYNGTTFSRARFFIEDNVAPSPILVRVASYSDSHNTEQFTLYTQLIKGANTESACLTDPNMAGAVVHRNNLILLRRAV